MQQKKKADQGAPQQRTQKWIIQGYVIDSSKRCYVPPSDIIELDDRILILVEIAGMQTADFQITIRERRLIVAGDRQRPPLTNPVFHQAEIGFGEFRLEVVLPWVADPEAVSATYEQGFLQIELPRRATSYIHIAEVTAEVDTGEA